jgi:CubicO group peptidase (beta-lactamase class C family)
MIPRLVAVCGVLGVLVAAAASGQARATPDGGALASKVNEIFAEYDKTSSPGCTVGLYQGAQIVYRHAYGMANLDHDVKLKPASVFHVASVSKQFTAAAILLLAGEGKLSIDDDVRKYIPELPDFGERITIRHLANHTSGIRDQWALLGLAGWRYSRDLITDDDVLELLARQKDLNFKPGERHVYSNSGYTLMAIIVSRVSGKSFREFTSERIFKPLGMVNTHFRDNFNEIVKDQAYGYARDGGEMRLSVTNFDTAGATSLMTTVEDLAKWHANFDDPTVGGARLISGLLERGVLNDGTRLEYAFGIGHGTYRGQPTVSHGGADAGYRSVYLRFPEQRVGVAVLCNLASASPIDLAQRVADVFLADKLTPVQQASVEQSPEVTISADLLRRYAGFYWNSETASARRVEFDDGRLFAVVGSEKLPMKSLGGGRFVLTAGPRTRLTFESAGANGSMQMMLGVPPIGRADIFERTEPFAPSATALQEFAGIYRSDEIEAVYRMVMRDGALRLERLKARPAGMQPAVLDTFTTQIGTIRFVRNSSGTVTGFELDAGRVRHVKFRRETATK